MEILYLITARGGSKGIPGKNIKPLAGRPLICHAIDHARGAGASDSDICVSTDSEEIARVVRDYGIEVPFMRPAELASDTAGSYEVIVHSLDYYRSIGKEYDVVVLLQPTSPLRRPEDITAAIEKYRHDLDMVVTVREARSNPYYGVFEPDEEGFMRISKGDGHYTRRQDAPKVYEYNGAVYVMNVDSLRRSHMRDFRRILPSEMPSSRSLDLDTPLDWQIAEQLLSEHGSVE